MSDYKRGKVCVELWAHHWEAVAEMSDARKTTEADLVDYGTAIRTAFSSSRIPNILLLTPRIKKTHRIIMGLPKNQRELLLSWHFESDSWRVIEFGRSDREPSTLNAIYKKIGRKM